MKKQDRKHPHTNMHSHTYTHTHALAHMDTHAILLVLRALIKEADWKQYQQ